MDCVGIGCFWFAARQVTSDLDFESFSTAGFLHDIKRELETVDNITDVAISGNNPGINILPFGDRLSDDYSFFPLFENLEITFHIFIPHRLQKLYGLGWIEMDPEHFQVIIRYGWEMPVTYVRYSMPTGQIPSEQSPSKAIVFIREYLQKKLEGSSTVKFQSLGPSPFHANFILDDIAETSEQGVGADLQDISITKGGYKTFLCYTDRVNQEAFNALLRSISLFLNHFTILSAFEFYYCAQKL